MEEERRVEEELNALNPDAHWAARYLSEEREREDREETEHKDQATGQIQVSTLNIGTWKNIMAYDGTPKASFLMFVTTRRREACVIFLQELHLTHKADVWLRFQWKMNRLAPWLKVGKLVGPAGTCIMYSHSIQHASDKIIHKEQNSVRLEIRRTNVKDNGSRTIIYGVYFPFSQGKLSEILPTLKDIHEKSVTIVSNIVFVTGDFNAERWNKKAYTAELAKATLKRVQTPIPTGKPHKERIHRDEKGDDAEASKQLSGGRAQAIWTTKPELVEEIDVLTMYDDLSNHHRPVVFSIPWTSSENPHKPLNLFNEMRFVSPKYPLADEMNKASTFEDLMEIIDACTTKKAKPMPYSKRRKKRNISESGTKQEKKERIEQVRNMMRRTVARKEREIFNACVQNTPLLKSALFNKRQDTIPECVKPNGLYAQAMKQLSFCKKDIEPDPYFDGTTVFSHVPEEVKSALFGPYSWLELIEARKLLGHTKTYADLEAKVAHVMCDVPLKIMAAKFTKWAQIESITEWEMMYSKLIGIPTNKPHTETEIHRILQKMRRPIGILPLFRAWFYCAQAIRMKRLVKATAPSNMHGSIPEREGHEMSLRLLILNHACERRPLWVIQMDLVKYYDVIQHQLITTLDKVIKLPEPFFQVLSKQFETVVHQVRIVQGEAELMQQESGGTQGTATVPALAVLILAPLAQKLNEVATKSQAQECPTAPPGMRSTDMFVDDMTLTSDTSKEGIARTQWARTLLKLIGVDAKIVAVACNAVAMEYHRHDYDPDRDPDYDPHCVYIDNERHEIKHSIRILGQCIHLKKDSECAPTKCKRCNAQSLVRMCCECEQEVLFNVRALPVKQVDQVECMNQRVLASLAFGAYSCPKQRTAMVKVENNIRKTLFGYGAGGYIVGAHLPAKKMGLGLRDTKRFLAIETASIIERSLARGEMMQRVADMLKRTGTWPESILQALKGHEDEDMIVIGLHDDCMKFSDPANFKGSNNFEYTTTAFQSNRKSQHERAQMKWKSERRGHTTYVAAILRSTTGAERTLHRKSRQIDAEFATIRCLAEIIEVTRKDGTEVTFEDKLPSEIEKCVKPFRNVYESLGKANRVFYSVIARTRVHRFMDPPITDLYEKGEEIEAVVIPDAYPMTVKLWGIEKVITGSTKRELTEALNARQESEFWEENRQLKVVCEPLHLEEISSKFSLETTCPIAGVRCGIFYKSVMPARRANLLMRVITGTAYKTVEIFNKKGDRRELRQEEYCKHPGCQGKVITMQHMLDHVSHEQRMKVVEEVRALKPKWEWTHRYPNLHCFLGLVHRGFTRYLPCREDEKEHTQYLKKAAAMFAEEGLKAIEKCLGQSSHDDTPDLEIAEKHLQAEDFDYQGYADAGTYVHKDKKGRRYFLGLGGLVRNRHGVVARFQCRVEVPVELFNSTVGEHLAHIVLIKVAKYHNCNNTCFLCDNNSVTAHLDGEFACNTPEINIIRRTTYRLLTGLRAERGWLPRLKNIESDALAKQAAHDKHPSHDQELCREEYFTEMRAALKEAIEAVAAWE